MSVFDLFRGFFGVPGGRYGRDGRRDPFFDGMTHEDDDDDEEDGFYHDSFRGVQQDPFDDALRFGFSFGPNGMRIEESEMFGQVFREMEQIFSHFGSLGREPGAGHLGVPSIQPPPPQDGPGNGGRGSSRNSLRDFMLKSPDDDPRGGRPSGLPSVPRNDGSPPSGPPLYPSTPFSRWTPFPKSGDIWRGRPQRGPEEERKEDRDLDGQVSSGGLDQILTPPPAHRPSQPKTHSFFQSVTVTKVVKPDGSVEERRTVRDGQGNEETTVTHSGGPQGPRDQAGPLLPGGPHPFPDLQDNSSVFSKFFGGFRG